jgi:hypothetical protein
MSDYYARGPVLLQYGPPAPPPSTANATVGKVLTVLFSVVGPPAAAFLGFLAAITWTGCFIECSDSRGDHLSGGLLGALAVAVLLAAPVLAATLVRRAVWVLGAIAVPVAEVLLLVVGVPF